MQNNGKENITIKPDVIEMAEVFKKRLPADSEMQIEAVTDKTSVIRRIRADGKISETQVTIYD